MSDKEKIVETATVKNNTKEISMEKIVMKEFHSKIYLENLKKTTYKGKEVVFILPNGKEYK